MIYLESTSIVSATGRAVAAVAAVGAASTTVVSGAAGGAVLGPVVAIIDDLWLAFPFNTLLIRATIFLNPFFSGGGPLRSEVGVLMATALLT